MNRALLIPTALLTVLTLTAAAQGPPPQYPEGQSYYQDPYAGAYPAQPSYRQQPGPREGEYPPAQTMYQDQQAPDNARLSQQDLSNLVAPIALYPDMLLSQVLAASTYPAEIIEAQQWMRSNGGLRGRQLVDAAKQQNWDPSVQALVAFPDVMNLLTRDMQWTTALGNAFLTQQADVMDSIQGLRASARDNGRLANTPQQQVTYDQGNGPNAIMIQPTDPEVVYPPVYNPESVWGPPAYGMYPSLGYPADYGIAYGAATMVGSLFSGLWSYGGWGWGFNWVGHGLFLNNLFFSHYGFHGGYGYAGYGRGYGYGGRSAWVHDPGHRWGVPYGNRFAGSRYAGGSNRGGGNSFRSQGYGSSNYSGRGNNSGRSYYGGSGYGGGNRQAEAYRGLSGGSAGNGRYGNYSSGYRAGGSSGSNYGSGRSYGAGRSFGGQSSGGQGSIGQGHGGQSYGGQSYGGQSYGRGYSGAPSQSYRGSYSSGSQSAGRWSTPSSYRDSYRGGSSSSHFSAPQSSGRSFSGGGRSFGGGGHSFSGGGRSSGGGGHSSSGGGHSQGSHNKR